MPRSSDTVPNFRAAPKFVTRTPLNQKSAPNRPSSSRGFSQSSSSQASRFKQTSSALNDEIETSFDEQLPSSSPTSYSLGKFLRRSNVPDAIDESSVSDDETEHGTEKGIRFLNKRDGLHFPSRRREQDEHDAFKLSEHDLIQDPDDGNDKSRSARKRRKFNSSIDHNETRITLPPTSVEIEPPSPEEQDVGAFGNDDTDEDMQLSPKPNTSTISSRFKTPVRSVSAGSRQPTKPIFKRPPVQQSHDLGSSSRASLPETFSPSRRKGKREYIAGGNADVVRSWILGLGAMEGKAAHTEAVEEVYVSDAVTDADGRCVLVVDAKQEKWLFIGQPRKAGSHSESQSDPRSIKRGKTIEVRASGISWNVGIQQQPAQPGISDLDGELVSGESVRVSVLWNLKS